MTYVVTSRMVHWAPTIWGVWSGGLRSFLLGGTKSAWVYQSNKRLQGNSCILWIDIAWGLQNLGILLENFRRFIVSNDPKMKFKDDFWYIKFKESTWRYVNSQNIAISLKPIHFINKIKLILYPRARKFITHLKIMGR